MTKDPKRKIFYTGRIFVISGPSGCGKTTLCSALLKKEPALFRSVSVTTRSLRKGEKRNRDYIYVTKEQFKKQIKDGKFLEYAKVFGSYYGTPKAPVLKRLKDGKNILLSIDVQGAAKIKKIFKNAVFIFILPPALSELEKRLLKRSADTDLQIRKRLKIACDELAAIGMYDYAVVNDDIDEAVGELLAIVKSERGKSWQEKKCL